MRRRWRSFVSPRYCTSAGFFVPDSILARSAGGVLAALPALLKEGLLSETGLLPLLPKGYYGLPTILLFLAFMTLARVRNPESLRYQAPGEWGAVLGLDRCPEVKTLRRKIGLMANDEASVQAWQLALARRWQADEPELWATLAVDGHVKVYAGRKGRLPKHFVSREKLCLPASASYWVNAHHGRKVPSGHRKPLAPGVAARHPKGCSVAKEPRSGLTRRDPRCPVLTSSRRHTANICEYARFFAAANRRSLFPDFQFDLSLQRSDARVLKSV